MSLPPAKLLASFDTLPVVPASEYDVDLSYETLCAFSFRCFCKQTALRVAARSAWRATMTLNGKPLLSGLVDDVNLDEEREADSLRIGGRESAAAAADCDCIDPADYSGLPLAVAAPKIFLPFKLKLKLGPLAAKIICTDKALGQRPLDWLRRAADEAGLIVWTDPALGVIYLDDAAVLLAAARAKPPIRLARIPGFAGNNIESFVYRDEKAKKMNTVVGTGHVKVSALTRTAAATQQIPAWAQSLPLPDARPPADPQLADYRPMTIEPRVDDAATAAKAARRALNKRAAEAYTISYVVAGLTDKTGAPYSHLRMAEVADAEQGIYGSFFVKACRYQSHRQVKGEFKICTTLDLIDPGVLAA
jgi:prophage tail gpP-like protein